MIQTLDPRNVILCRKYFSQIAIPIFTALPQHYNHSNPSITFRVIYYFANSQTNKQTSATTPLGGGKDILFQYCISHSEPLLSPRPFFTFSGALSLPDWLHLPVRQSGVGGTPTLHSCSPRRAPLAATEQPAAGQTAARRPQPPHCSRWKTQTLSRCSRLLN